MNLTKTCKHERDHCKREFEECTRIQSCKHDEIEMYKRDADKCHEHKKEYQVEITSLQDKVRKTHTERSTFIRESHTEIERVTKNCDVDSTVMNEFMNKFQTSLLELNKVKDSIYRDSSVDQFDLSKQQTEIQMKTEEIKRYEIKITQSTDEVNGLKAEIEKLSKKIDENKQKDNTALIRELKEKFESDYRNKVEAMETQKKLSSVQSEINILKNQINVNNNLKQEASNKYAQINNVYVNIQNNESDIKNYYINKTTKLKTDKKLNIFKKIKLPEDPFFGLIKVSSDMTKRKLTACESSGSEKDKEILRLKDQISKLLLEKKQSLSLEVDIVSIIEKRNYNIMVILDNINYVEKNCKNFNAFKEKFEGICKIPKDPLPTPPIMKLDPLPTPTPITPAEKEIESKKVLKNRDRRMNLIKK